MTPESENESESEDESAGPSSAADESSTDSDEESDDSAGPTLAPEVAWNWSQAGGFVPNVPHFDDFASGFTFPTPEHGRLSALEILKLTFPEQALEFVVEQSNKYAEECIQRSNVVTRRMLAWTPLNKEELLRFLALRIIMGINPKPQLNHYWKKDPLFSMPIVSRIMKSDRYFEIHKYLHFSNNELQAPGDRLHKISHLWKLWTDAWQSIVVPFRELSVDESIMGFKGRLFCKQYCPMKRERFGVKTFSIVDDSTGMVLNSIIYSGKGHVFGYSSKDYGYGGSIVMDLLEPYLGKGHHLYCDNYFSSPNLALKLLGERTSLTGTVRRNRKHMPKLARRMKKGEVQVFHANEVLVEYWRDKRPVAIITTGHAHEMVESRGRHSAVVTLKPRSVIEYNSNARGIDELDKMESYYTTLRKTMKWTKKVFFSGFERCLINALRIQQKLYGEIPYLDFRIMLVKDILGATVVPIQIRSINDPLRLEGKHFPANNTPTSKQKHGSRRCVVCSSKSLAKKSKFHCKTCLVPLCIVPCFEIYHSRAKY
jgi:hypothetical protein